MANALTYDSVDLGGASYGLVVESNRFVDPPQPRLTRVPLAAADGEASQGATFGARAGVVSGIITAASYSALKTQKENVFAALAVGQEGPKALSFDAYAGLTWQARVLNVAFSDETAVTLQCDITFVAAEPWAQGTLVTGSDQNVSSGGTEL